MTQFLIPENQGCSLTASHVQSSKQIDLSLSKGETKTKFKATLLDHILRDQHFSNDTNNIDKEAYALCTITL